jgi:hypothetical protein
MPACLVGRKFGLFAPADEAHEVSLAHHLNEAYSGVEVY